VTGDTSDAISLDEIELDQKLIIRTIGSLPPGMMQPVDDCLKAALALP
jgi:hypothetical protein